VRPSQVGVWILDLDTGAMSWSEELHAIHGIDQSSAALTLESLAARVHPEDRTSLEAVLATARQRAGESMSAVHYRVLAADGSVRHVFGSGRVMCDDSGRRFVVGTMVDATAQLEATRESGRLAKLVTENPIAMCLVRDGRVVYCNAAMCELAGRPVAAILGCAPEAFVVEGEEDTVRGRIRAITEGAAVGPGGLHLRRPDGSVVAVEVRSRRLLLEDGQALVSCIIDVSRREQAEESARLRARLLDEVDGAVALVRIDGTVESWNDGGTRLFGYRADEMLGQHISVLHFPEERERSRVVLEQAVVQGAVQAEMLLRRKDGSRVWVELRVTPDYDAHGRITGIVGFAVDISARRRAEISLKESEMHSRSQVAELSRLYNELPFGLCVLSPELRFVRANPALASFRGVTVAELLGRTLKDALPDVADALEGHCCEVLATGNPSVGNEIRLDGEAGDERYWRASFYPHLGGAGAIEGIAVIIEDVSVARRREEALHGAIADRDGLLRELHHRVKNSLQVVSSLLGLEAASAGPETAAVLAANRRRVQAMALVYDMLDRSKPRAGIDLRAYFQSLVHLLSSLGDGRICKFRSSTETRWIEIDTAIPCGLIVAELVSLFFEHQQDARRTPVTIELAFEGDDAVLAVHGDGLPAGFDLGEDCALGPQIAKRLAGQVRGQLTLDADEVPARLSLRWPLSERR